MQQLGVSGLRALLVLVAVGCSAPGTGRDTSSSSAGGASCPPGQTCAAAPCLGPSCTPSAGGDGVVPPGGSNPGDGAPGAPAGSGGTGGASAPGGDDDTDPSGGSGGSGGNAGPSGFGGYIISGRFQGYAWTDTSAGSSTIAPGDYASVMEFPLCASGTVAGGYENVAMVGWNLNQGTAAGDPKESITLAMDGLSVELSNTAGSPLRLQLEGEGGGRWCAPITQGGGFIAYGSFNTECWEGGNGTPYGGEPVVAAVVLVPGAESAPVDFDFCLEGLAEAVDDGSGGAGGSGGDGDGDGDSGPSTFPPLEGGCSGYATRYWDCCKAHCGWTGNVPGGVAPLTSCGGSDQSLGGDYGAQSSCNGGGAFMCQNLAPWAVDGGLSYGFAATQSGDICGRCYQLQFTGQSHNAGNDPGSSALAGKTMIVQATNVGFDVAGGQFDILVPGGGVGAFNACSSQWGVSNNELGAQYGGFLTTCKQQQGSSDHGALKSCVMSRCNDVFGSRGLTELVAGCQWFVDWFEVADNPSLLYREVECPGALRDLG
ncbi:MAG: hypothetical protein OXT09_32105, partial [Myxococcales bacterium]|nr:hypothetical protein [Myxococcales bacterium]